MFRYGRLAVGSLALLFSTSFAAAQAEAKVTFTCRAETMDRALKDLSAAANVHLEAIPALEREVVVISVKDVPLPDLLARIAVATSGEWKQVDGGYRLLASTPMRTAEERQALAERVASIQATIKQGLAVTVKKTPGNPPKTTGGGSQEADDMPDFSEDMFDAGNRNLYQILAQCDAKAIAQVGSGQRLVFSTHPTKMQLAFNGSISDAVNLIVTEHNKTAVNPGTTPEQEDQIAQMPEFVRKMVNNMSKPIGAVSKALVVVTNAQMGDFGGPMAELKLYDNAGQVAFTTNVQLHSPDPRIQKAIQDAMMKAKTGSAPKTPPAPATSTPVTLSEDTKQFLQIFQSSGSAQMSLKIPAEIKAKLFRPDQYDPLSFLISDELLSLAKTAGKPLVACVPDAAMSGLDMVTNDKPTVEQFQKDLADKSTMAISADPQWIVIRPAAPPVSRSDRQDRAGLTRLLQATLQKGAPSLDDVADYAMTSPFPMTSGIGQLYVFMLAPGSAMQGMGDMVSWEALRFYGSFDSSGRGAIRNGGRIPFSGLNEFARTQVEKMVYGANALLEVAGANKGDADMFPSYLRSMMPSQGGDYQQEPTEILPNGLPNDGFVNIAVSKEPVACMMGDDGNTATSPLGVMDADMLAAMRMFEQPEFSVMSSMLPPMNKLRVGERDLIRLTMQLTPKISVTHTLTDNHVPKSGDLYTDKTLPANFQQLIAQRLEKLKKSPLGSLGSMMGGMGGAPTVKP